MVYLVNIFFKLLLTRKVNYLIFTEFMEVGINYCFCRKILQIEVLYHVVCTPARVVYLILGEKYISSGVELHGK